jgi:hypothetical protein
MSDVKYPEIEVELIGTDGNAFAILGKVQEALKRGGVPAGRDRRLHQRGDQRRLRAPAGDLHRDGGGGLMTEKARIIGVVLIGCPR